MSETNDQQQFLQDQRDAEVEAARKVPLEEMFPNDPHFVAKGVLLQGSVRNTGELETDSNSALAQMGEAVAVALLGAQRSYDNLGWMAKKGRDGIQAALEETLFKAMNVAMGLPEDHHP